MYNLDYVNFIRWNCGSGSSLGSDSYALFLKMNDMYTIIRRKSKINRLLNEEVNSTKK